jgi:ornithine cyclodeaminase
MPPRVGAAVPDRDGLLAAMPAYLPSAGALTTKLVTVFPHNQARPTHQAVICCFDPADGSPLAVIDGTLITATRTAAGSALASRLLARDGAKVVCVIGTGVQARSHARALARHPGVDRLRIAGRSGSAVASFVASLADLRAVTVEAAPSLEDAVRSADIVCATTHAEEPVVRREWLRPGTHVNSVGYNTAGRGEIDSDTVRDALIAVESRQHALAAPPAGAPELLRAIEDGVITADHVQLELGELVAGTKPGRSDDTQLTLYKSVGVAVEDAATAALVLRAAAASGAGLDVDI